MSLRDPTTGLDCTETPLNPPRAASIGDVVSCTSCNLVISATVAGPKNYIFRDGKDGIGIDESPLASLTYNGHNYSLLETILWKRGAHRDFKADQPYDMEMNLYFRDIYESRNQVAVAIPLTITEARGVSDRYFTELTNQNGVSRSYTLESLIVPGPVLLYKGMDLRGRNADAPTAGTQCSNASATINWFVLPTTYIAPDNAAKIRSILNPSANDAALRASMNATQLARYTLSNALPPAPSRQLTLDRIRNMAMIVPTIKTQTQIDGASQVSAAAAASKNGVYLTRALQCQRIDPVRDVKNDAVYLPDSHGATTLKDELDRVSSLEGELTEISANAGARAGRIQQILSIVIGIVFGLLIFAIVAYFFLRHSYKGYETTIAENNAIIAAAAEAQTTGGKITANR